MKKLASLLVFILIISSIYSQSFHTVPYYDWSSKTSYMLSPSPMITGYGPLSNSLSKAHNNITFYECNDEYYPITSWADYYLWYVNKYWYHFDDPDLYAYFYMVGDDYGMAQYICGANYHGYMYPVRIAISFPGRQVYVNYYSAYRVKRRIKNDLWVNKNYVAVNEIDRKEFNGRNRREVANKLNSKDRNSKVVVRNYKVGERKIKQSLESNRYKVYTNGPSDFEKNSRGNKVYGSTKPGSSKSYQRSSITSNNTRINSSTRSSGSNTSINRSTNRNTSGTNSSSSSRQTKSGKSGRVR